MIAADDKDFQLPLSQTGQKTVKQQDGLRRRHRLVINVSCDQHALCSVLVDNFKNLIQNVLLIANSWKIHTVFFPDADLTGG